MTTVIPSQQQKQKPPLSSTTPSRRHHTPSRSNNNNRQNNYSPASPSPSSLVVVGDLFNACQTGDVDAVLEATQSSGYFVLSQSRQRDNYTPLLEACHYKQYEVVRAILEEAKKQDEQDEEEKSNVACGETKVQELLNQKTKLGGITPLIAATSAGSLEVVKILLEFGADIEQQDDHGNRPLLVAAREGFVDLVSFFISYARECHEKNPEKFPPLQINAANHDRATAFSVSCSNGAVECAKILLFEGNADPSLGPVHPLFPACQNGRQEVVELMLSYLGQTDFSFDVNKLKQRTGATCLLVAVQSGNANLVKYLVEVAGADIYETTLDGWSSLHTACWCNNNNNSNSIAEFLLQKDSQKRKCLKDMKTAEGKTAMDFALQKKNVKCAQALDPDFVIDNNNNEDDQKQQQQQPAISPSSTRNENKNRALLMESTEQEDEEIEGNSSTPGVAGGLSKSAKRRRNQKLKREQQQQQQEQEENSSLTVSNVETPQIVSRSTSAPRNRHSDLVKNQNNISTPVTINNPFLVPPTAPLVLQQQQQQQQQRANEEMQKHYEEKLQLLEQEIVQTEETHKAELQKRQESFEEKQRTESEKHLQEISDLQQKNVSLSLTIENLDKNINELNDQISSLVAAAAAAASASREASPFSSSLSTAESELTKIITELNEKLKVEREKENKLQHEVTVLKEKISHQQQHQQQQQTLASRGSMISETTNSIRSPTPTKQQQQQQQQQTQQPSVTSPQEKNNSNDNNNNNNAIQIQQKQERQIKELESAVHRLRSEIKEQNEKIEKEKALRKMVETENEKKVEAAKKEALSSVSIEMEKLKNQLEDARKNNNDIVAQQASGESNNTLVNVEKTPRNLETKNDSTSSTSFTQFVVPVVALGVGLGIGKLFLSGNNNNTTGKK